MTIFAIFISYLLYAMSVWENLSQKIVELNVLSNISLQTCKKPKINVKCVKMSKTNVKMPQL